MCVCVCTRGREFGYLCWPCTSACICAVCVRLWLCKSMKMILTCSLLFIIIRRLHSAAQVWVVTVCVLFHQLHGSYGSFERWSKGAYVPPHVWKPACWTWEAISAAKPETVLGLPGSERGIQNSCRHFTLLLHTVQKRILKCCIFSVFILHMVCWFRFCKWYRK